MVRLLKFVLCLIAICIISKPVLANGEWQQNCPNLFLNSTPPTYSIKHTQELCNTQYAVLYSLYTKTPLISVEHITQDNFVKRDDKFKGDSRIPLPYRSLPSNYSNSGYDKGHLTPSGDMNSEQSQAESFLLSNISPQAPKLNQQHWRELEAKVKQGKWEYRITGVGFTDNTIKVINNNVGIPTIFYKIVSNGVCSSAWIADNKNGAVIQETSVDSLEELSKIKFNLPKIKCE